MTCSVSHSQFVSDVGLEPRTFWFWDQMFVNQFKCLFNTPLPICFLYKSISVFYSPNLNFLVGRNSYELLTFFIKSHIYHMQCILNTCLVIIKYFEKNPQNKPIAHCPWLLNIVYSGMNFCLSCLDAFSSLEKLVLG